MKKTYPSYEKKGTDFIKEGLKGNQKKIYENYMIHLSSEGAGKNTIYRKYKPFFLQFIDIIEKPLDKLEPQDMKDFWALVNEDDTREVNTKNGIKTSVKRFLKWYYEDDLKMIKLMDKLKLKHQIVNEKRLNKNALLTDKQIEDMKRVPCSIRDKCQFVTQLLSASRPHELRNAKWGAVDFDKKTIHLYASKTGKAREIPIGDAIVYLKRWKQEFSYPDVSDDDYIFPNPTYRNNPIGHWTFGVVIKNIAKKAGIKKPVYSYILRHTFLHNLKQKYKVDDQLHKLFAGHSANSKMTAVYTHMDSTDMINEIQSKVYELKEISPEEEHELKKEVKELRDMIDNNIMPMLHKAVTIAKNKDKTIKNIYNSFSKKKKLP